jgi:hypothetical protein
MTSSTKVSISKDFEKSFKNISASDYKKVWRAVMQFQLNQQSNGLNLHPVQSDSSERLYTFRASDGLRVLVARLDKDHWVILEAGHHDDIYMRAALGRFIASADGSTFGFVTSELLEGNETSDSTTSATDSPQVLNHWSDDELKSLGFTDGEVERIRNCRSAAALLDLDDEIDDARLLLAIDLLEITPEQHKQRMRDHEDPRATGSDLVATATSDGARWGLSAFLEPEELDRLLQAPIEEWMLFLHPQQRALVTRSFEGPARIGGPAGTGKTVVALHRAAELARRFREEDPKAKVLFTTYISTLPPVFESLYNRLPNAIPGAVEFINVDAIARRICEDAGMSMPTKKDEIEKAFSAAWDELVIKGSALERSSISPEYVREEIEIVIKGHNITSVDEYLDIERTGRRTPLQSQQRKQIWGIRMRFDDLMSEAGTIDFADRRLRALELLEGRKPVYRAAIIDEAQDLSLSALQIIRKLVNGEGPDRPDGLLLVGDGAQRIYASCFTLKQAGLEVRGRSTILEQNYRNTEEILEAAMAVAGDQDVDDLGDVRKRRTSTSSDLPHGQKPRLVRVADYTESSNYIGGRIIELMKTNGYSLSDIAVLTPTNGTSGTIQQSLSRANIDTSELRQLKPNSTPTLRIGTFWRSKGLEFKAALIVGAERFPWAQRAGEDETAFQERTERELSALFVAMTRAREVLDVISVGDPTEPIKAASAAFDLKTNPFR